MSGGSGTRLWPLSTDVRPKQFHALGSERSLIQDSLLRIADGPQIDVLPPILIGNQGHLALIEADLAAIDMTAGAIVLEPFGRNTAPAAAVAALLAEAADPQALVLLMPADHVIAPGFDQTVARVAPVAREHIVVFGVDPTGPETGYGYIEGAEDLPAGARRVRRFTEKPDLETAEAYLAGGGHLWNAGIFLFSPKVMLEELRLHAPETLAAAQAALDAAARRDNLILLDPVAFAEAPATSLDVAVMEHSARGAVTPIGVDWADVGSWSELWRLGPRDESGNVLRGDTTLIDSQDCVVWSDGRPVSVIGMRDVVVVQTETAVLVLPRSRAQDVKQMVDLIKARAAKTDQ